MSQFDSIFFVNSDGEIAEIQTRILDCCCDKLGIGDEFDAPDGIYIFRSQNELGVSCKITECFVVSNKRLVAAFDKTTSPMFFDNEYGDEISNVNIAQYGEPLEKGDVIVCFPDQERLKYELTVIPSVGDYLTHKEIKYIVRHCDFNLDTGNLIIYVDFA